MNRLPTDMTFPSQGNRKALHQRLTQAGWNALSESDKWNWHAYVYAMRRVFLGVSHDLKISPPDPSGDFFSAELADAAEAWYRKHHGRTGVEAHAQMDRDDFKL